MYLSLRGIMHEADNAYSIIMQNVTCKDNNNSKNRAATFVKFEIRIK